MAAHWACLAKTQRDEILKAAFERDKAEWQAAKDRAAEKGEEALEKLRDRRLGVDSRSKPPPQTPSKHSFAAKAKTMKAKHEGKADTMTRSASASHKGDERNNRHGAQASKKASESDDSDSSDDGEGFFQPEPALSKPH